MTSKQPEPIPQPRSVPLFGNALALDDRKAPLRGLVNLAKTFGPLFRFDIPGKSFLVASSHEIISEACDTKRFSKALHPAFVTLRPVGGDGLVTAYNDETQLGKSTSYSDARLQPCCDANLFRRHGGYIFPNVREMGANGPIRRR